MSKHIEFEQLREHYANACAILKSVSDNAQKTYVRVYTEETGEWSNLYSYNVPYDVIREMRTFIESINIRGGKP